MEVGLVALLRLTWVAAILPIILASLRLRPFHQTILGLAKRGKTMHPSSSKFTVPQRFFSHFYMVGTLWTTLLLLTTWLYACTAGSTSSTIFALHKSHRVWRALFLLWLMEAQVLRRLYESLYVFHYRPLARMHIFGYFIGMSYYIVASLSLCCTCAPEVFEFTLDLVSEGRKQWQPLEVIGGNRSPLWLGWKQWVGSAIFLWGWIHQLRILVIYVGLLIASGGADITIWLLLAFVVTNLGFAAAETQKWYIGKFEDYPKHRYAMIPFIF
ncbi:polyprenol reductase 2 isoform X3 [Gossypium hirsutum]|uniref:Polyprenol reductase 2 isoform X3 n=1 Tax=Gossypium hirsutum TaxID=3635 RepID=A0ABM2ZEM9_GOSHI|nr:polyprenol reductase 2-like isoform X3 [Gossypium hirsutum]